MDKETYRQKVEAQLKEWKTKIDMLEEKASKASGERKAELVKAIGELRQKKDVVKEKWTKLQKEGGVAWESMKEGVEKAVADMKQALDKLLARFK